MTQKTQSFIELFEYLTCSKGIHEIERSFDFKEQTFRQLKDRLAMMFPLQKRQTDEKMMVSQNDFNEQINMKRNSNLIKWRDELQNYLRRALKSQLINSKMEKLFFKPLVRINFQLSNQKLNVITL